METGYSISFFRQGVAGPCVSLLVGLCDLFCWLLVTVSDVHLKKVLKNLQLCTNAGIIEFSYL
jgi:hypothetical protein